MWYTVQAVPQEGEQEKQKPWSLKIEQQSKVQKHEGMENILKCEEISSKKKY